MYSSYLSKNSKINECDSEEETEEKDNSVNDIKINMRMSDQTEELDSSLMYNLIDVVYESVIELEQQLKDLFRPERRDSSISHLKRDSEMSKYDKRKTVVMANVPHFQKALGKTKKNKKKGMMDASLTKD
jgi:hypothetical protein